MPEQGKGCHLIEEAVHDGYDSHAMSRFMAVSFLGGQEPDATTL